MIVLPETWSRTSSVGTDVFASPDRTWQIRYRMRVTPLRRVAAIVDDALAELPEWRSHTAAPREHLVTHEGEHAFGVSLAGAWLGGPARRYIAVIYGDDFFDVLDAIALGVPAIDDRMRLLVRTATLRLGSRRRRYFYDRPSGWHGHATGLTAHWFPPTFPARPSTIIVYPANPTNDEPQAVFDAMVAHHQTFGTELRELEPPAAIAARDGLTGLHWSLTCLAPNAPTIARDLVIYMKGAYTYALQLDSWHGPDHPARALFLALARSAAPVPTGGAIASESTVFSHYV